MDKLRLEQFFASYKKLASKRVVEVQGWGDAAAARQAILEAFARYDAARAEN